MENRRYDDTGEISHTDRHLLIESRVTVVERRQMFVLVMLAIDTILTGGDIVTKLGPIIHAFGFLK